MTKTKKKTGLSKPLVTLAFAFALLVTGLILMNAEPKTASAATVTNDYAPLAVGLELGASTYVENDLLIVYPDIIEFGFLSGASYPNRILLNGTQVELFVIINSPVKGEIRKTALETITEPASKKSSVLPFEIYYSMDYETGAMSMVTGDFEIWLRCLEPDGDVFIGPKAYFSIVKGSFNNYDIGYEIRELRPLPADPEKPGYTFEGWFYDENYETPYGGEPIFTNTVLYAKFDVITYDITYNLAGGTNDPGNPSSYTVASGDITLAAPTRTGHRFLGWKETGTIPNGSTGDKHFTAEWELLIFKVTFMVDGAEYIAIDVPCGTVLTENRDVQTLMRVLKLSGYTDEEAASILASTVSEDLTLNTTGDKGTLNAVGFFAWLFQWWWTVLAGFAVVAGVIAFLVYRKKKRT